MIALVSGLLQPVHPFAVEVGQKKLKPCGSWRKLRETPRMRRENSGQPGVNCRRPKLPKHKKKHLKRRQSRARGMLNPIVRGITIF